MIPADLSARLRMLAEASFFDSEPPVQGTARIREIQARLPELLPGQRFTAQLQRPLPDGTFQAVVAGRTYTLALNHAAKAGDTLELVVTQANSRAVYAQLASDGKAATAANAAAPQGNASLSAAGRLISFLLTGQPTPQPAALAGGKPILDAPPAVTTPAQLAPALRQALSQSGLFYESHQSEWVTGKRDARSLMREPQGQQSALRGSPPVGGGPQPSTGGATNLLQSLAGQPPLAAGNAGAAGPVLANAQPALPGPPATTPVPSGPAAPASALTAGSALPANAPVIPSPPGASTPAAGIAHQQVETLANAGNDEPVQSSAATTQRLPAVPERLMPLVQQQLDALATHTYVWQGQVWPGQAMEWEIEDPDHGEDHARGDDAAREWNTTLRLALPRLGGVEARLQLTPAGVALRLVADTPEAVAALDAARAELDESLSAANVPLTGFVAERRDAAG